MHILIAEDDSLARQLLSAAIVRLGHTVTEAEDGQQAWAAFEKSPFRVVVSDWLMPRLSGLDLCRKIRENHGPEYTYFIMVTIQGDTAHHKEAMAAGVDDFLSKPIDYERLAMRLKVASRIVNYQSKISDLEDLITICAYTKKIKRPGHDWQSVESFIQEFLGVQLSHGIEPEYYQNKLLPEIERLRVRMLEREGVAQAAES